MMRVGRHLNHVFSIIPSEFESEAYLQICWRIGEPKLGIPWEPWICGSAIRNVHASAMRKIRMGGESV